MFVAMRNARVNDKFQDSLYLFLELVRAGVMHGHLWSGRAFSGGPSFGTGTGNPFSRFSVVLLTSAFFRFFLGFLAFVCGRGVAWWLFRVLNAAVGFFFAMRGVFTVALPIPNWILDALRTVSLRSSI